MRLLLLIILSGVTISSALSQTNQAVFDYNVNQSTVIIEGKIIQQTSYWDATKNLIFTDNLLTVYKSIKGSQVSNQITFTTQGGQVGNEKLVVNGLLQPKLGDQGIYYLTLKNGN